MQQFFVAYTKGNMSVMDKPTNARISAIELEIKMDKNVCIAMQSFDTQLQYSVDIDISVKCSNKINLSSNK